MELITLAESGVPESVLRNIVPLTGIVVAGIVTLIWVVAATLDSTIKAKGRERSRRELAAYVAEGSVTPADAEKLLKAEPKSACSW